MGKFNPSQSLLLVHADNLSWFDLGAFLWAHQSRPKGTEMTMMTFCTDSPQTCGIVELDQNGAVRQFYEKDPGAPGNLANGAVYLISPEGLERIRSLGEVTEFSTQVIPAFMGKIHCWQNTTYHRDIGNPDSYRLAQSEFQSILTKFNLFTE
jgi:mannose-1-phosphate guanylyltransferase